jgi:hypothetical protein
VAVGHEACINANIRFFSLLTTNSPKDYDNEPFDIAKLSDTSWLFALAPYDKNAIVLRKR